MLTPDYLDKNADVLLDYYRDLENYIIHDIAMRLLKAGEMSGTADYELWKLEQMGMHRAEILKKLSQITGMSTAELRKLLQDAILTSWEGDAADFSRMGIELENPLENPAVISIMDAQWKKTQGELSNLTRTTMLQSQRDLVSLLNQADMRIGLGVQSTSAAICEILDQYAGRGVVISYPSGTMRSLEAAVRCCVVTSANQTAAQVTNYYVGEHKREYVLVSAHMGARHNDKHPSDLYSHDWWQGKIYKIHGSEDGIPNLLESTGYDIRDGIGIVVNPNGLHGYNCRHSHQAWDKEWENPWLDENGNPKIDQEESRKQYALTQKQRAMERAIRKTKRQLLVKQAELDAIAETDVRDILQPEYDKLAYKLRMQNKQYDDFCGKNDLRTQSERVKVAGFKGKQAAAARGRATAYQNSTKVPMEKSKNTGYTKRTKEEFEQAARQIRKEIAQYSDRPSKWSGNINVNSKFVDENTQGMKEWSCDISVIDTADDGVLWHEMLHSCSASYYDQKTYAEMQAIEEASVEYLKQQICEKCGIYSSEGYVKQVQILKAINNKFEYGTDMDFALELFRVPLPERYRWLEDKVDDSLRAAEASFPDYNDVMLFLQELSGEIR